MDVGFSVWLVRQAQGMTQNQLARRMQTTRQQISDLEIGQSPTLPTLNRLAVALEVDVLTLLRLNEVRCLQKRNEALL